MKDYVSLKEIQNDIFAGDTSVKALVESYLKVIEEKQHLNAFNEVFSNEALALAAKIDEKIKAGTAGKLAGLVIGLKDNIVYKGHKATASSKILENFTSLYSATVVERLLAEDAIIIGRTNCDEFGMGSSNENSAYGRVKHPMNEKLVSGGSSGGSAAAVAAGMCHAALGTDTGGSIRQPASFCGLVGFKPSYGRVSRWGAIAYASSFDQIGPLTKSVYDAALIMEIMAGPDEYDSTASLKPVAKYSENLSSSKKYRFAYLKECIESPGLSEDIKTYFKSLFEKLKTEGHELVEVEFPYLDYLVPTYYVLTTAEASSNLSRYDGIHYGYRSKNAHDLESTYKKSRTEGFGKEVKRRIMLGTFVLSSGYYDAYYSKAQKVRRILRDKTNEILTKADFIILPTTPDVAFESGKNTADPIKMYLEDIFTVQANLVGLPAVSLPMGSSKDGQPFGVQIIGKMLNESELFRASEQLINTK